MSNIKRICVLGLVLVSFFVPRLVFSQGLKIGYVDIKEVFSKYTRAKELEAGFMKEVDTEQKKVAELEAKIKSMQKEFENKKDIMKPEDREKQESELRTNIQEFTKMWTDVNKKLDEKRKSIEEVLLEEIKKEVKSYGEKNGFTIILDSRLVIYGQDVVNISGEIIKAINKETKQ